MVIFKQGNKTYIVKDYASSGKKKEKKLLRTVNKIRTADSEQNQVVVAGYPEIKGEEARQVYDYAKEVGQVDIKENKTETGETTSYTVKPSSETYIRQRMEDSTKIYSSASTEETKTETPRLIYSTPVVDYSRPLNPSETYAPRGVGYFDPSKVNIYTLGVKDAEGNTYIKGEIPSVFGPYKAPEPYTVEAVNVVGRKAENLLFEGFSSNKPGEFVKDVGLGVSYAGVYAIGSVAVGTKNAIKSLLRPGETVMGQFKFFVDTVNNPVGSAKNVAGAFASNPISFTTEQVVFYKGLGLTFKAPRYVAEYVKGQQARISYNTMVETPVNIFDTTKEFKPYAFENTPKGEYQSTLYGSPAEVVNIPRSPLGLDSTPFYSEVVKGFSERLKAGETVKGTPGLEIDFPYSFTREVTTDLTPDYIRVRQLDSALEYDIPAKDFLNAFETYPPFEVIGRTQGKFFQFDKALYKSVLERTTTETPVSSGTGNFVGVEIIPGTRYVAELITKKRVLPEFKPSIRTETPGSIIDSSSPVNKVVDTSIIPQGVNALGKLGVVTLDKFRVVTIEPGKIMPSSLPESIQSPDISSALNYEPLNIPKSEISNIPSIRYSSRSKQEYTPALVTTSESALATDSISLTQSINRRAFTPLRTNSLTETPFRPILPKFKAPSNNNSFGGVFLAEVRRRGRFVSIGTFGTSREAFQRASLIVGTSASASLRVKDLRGGFASPEGFLGKDFIPSKREPGVFIERRSRRIKSAGELAEITYKGLLFKKTRTKRRGVLI